MRWLVWFVLCLPLWGARYPQLSPTDVLSIVDQMLAAHVTHKTVSPSVISLATTLFIEELDPAKLYFSAEEVTHVTTRTPEQWANTAIEFYEGNFSIFHEIYESFLHAVERRKEWLAHPTPSDQKDLDPKAWALGEEGLHVRWSALHHQRDEVLAQLPTENQPKVVERLKKRELFWEEYLFAGSPPWQNGFCYSSILKAIAGALDSHTCYFTPSEASEFMIHVQQRLFGIGIQLRDDLTGFTIVKVLENGPAHQQNKLQEGDRILTIDDEPLIGMDLLDVVDLIRGEAGTGVHLTLLREIEGVTEKLDFVVERGEVIIQESRLKTEVIPFGEGMIAILRLHSFYQDPLHSACGDLQEALISLRKEHPIKGVLIDLRQNTGGVLAQAVQVAGLFITKGIVASIKNHLGHIEHLRETKGKMLYDGPLVILTSKASASAAEIVAQSLQDYGRAIVVGEQTFGKGTFQVLTLNATEHPALNPKGELKVTGGRYYTVSGKSPQLVGVTPDITIPGWLTHADMGEAFQSNPLPNDAITEHFEDDLEDIPAFQREQIRWLYSCNLQPRLKIYQRYLPILRANSEHRVRDNPFYRHFLADLATPLSAAQFALYQEADPQLQEAIAILQDLILLLK